TPFIMGTPLFVKYLAVSGALIILMIIMKKGLERFEEKY
ncbi:MAG: TIGR02206 family membrane protein, partial [Streptococcus salivarius]|nr:TIGR02206 family membrane protein [Streptococcus salivarius]